MGAMIRPYMVDDDGLPELVFPEEPGIFLGKWGIADVEWDVVMIVFGDIPFLNYKVFRLSNGEEIRGNADGTFYFSEKLN
jgi:hypothetical protein